MRVTQPSLTVSIVIPAFNEEASVATCLDNCLAQTEPFDEIIIVDNNSTDKTAAIVKGYQKKHPDRIRLLKETKGQGPVFARDKGFDAARGDIIGRIDIDTQLQKDWTARLKKSFTDPDVMAVSGLSYFYDTPTKSRRVASRVHWFIAHRLNEMLAGGKMLFGSNMAIRRQAWQAVRKQVCSTRAVFEDLDLAIHCQRQNLYVAYDEDLVCAVSPRRYSTPLRSIGRYMRKWPRTFHVHGNKVSAAWAYSFIPIIVAFTYLPTYLVLRAYNPKTDKVSLRQFRQSKAALRD